MEDYFHPIKPKFTMKYTTATGKAVLRAYNRAAKAVAKDRRLSKSEHSAGFIMPKNFPKGEGYHVFVKIVGFSELKLKREPMSGGLLS